jgi:hypothetical protein
MASITSCSEEGSPGNKSKSSGTERPIGPPIPCKCTRFVCALTSNHTWICNQRTPGQAEEASGRTVVGLVLIPAWSVRSLSHFTGEVHIQEKPAHPKPQTNNDNAQSNFSAQTVISSQPRLEVHLPHHASDQHHSFFQEVSQNHFLRHYSSEPAAPPHSQACWPVVGFQSTNQQP